MTTGPADREDNEGLRFDEVGGEIVVKVVNKNATTDPVPVATTENTFTQALDNNSNGSPDFIGFAVPGTAKSAAGWQIRKITYSGVFVTDVQFADGNANFDNVWNDRSGLAYS